jgi:hypothetical protein
VVLAIGLGVEGVLNTTMALAQKHPVNVNAPDTIRQTLEQQLARRVKVKLESGQDLEGKVAKVGTHAVQVSKLSGMESFGGTIKLDEVAAVIVRVRTK